MLLLSIAFDTQATVRSLIKFCHCTTLSAFPGKNSLRKEFRHATVHAYNPKEYLIHTKASPSAVSSTKTRSCVSPVSRALSASNTRLPSPASADRRVQSCVHSSVTGAPATIECASVIFPLYRIWRGGEQRTHDLSGAGFAVLFPDHQAVFRADKSNVRMDLATTVGAQSWGSSGRASTYGNSSRIGAMQRCTKIGLTAAS